VTNVNRGVIEASRGSDSSDDLVDGDVHRVRGQLLPCNTAGGIDDENRVAVHRAHIHAARKPEDAKAGAEHVVSILEDRESELELSRQRSRSRTRVSAYAYYVTAGSLDRIQLSLQLHELLLTGASSASFIEVDDQLGAPEVGKRRRASGAGWNRVGGDERPYR